MRKYQSIYMWENVDMITQIFESQIDFIRKNDFCDSQYCYIENEYCLLQSSHIIR